MQITSEISVLLYTGVQQELGAQEQIYDLEKPRPLWSALCLTDGSASCLAVLQSIFGFPEKLFSHWIKSLFVSPKDYCCKQIEFINNWFNYSKLN